jgi:hypothetical protein
MLALILAAVLGVAPPAADTTPRWAQVSVGNDHACALDTAGRVYCWGSNHSAQLGARTPERCGIVGESGHRGCYPEASDTPVAAGGAMRFTHVSAGRSRSCGLTQGGAAYCWGADLPGAAGTCLNGTRCTEQPLPYEPSRRFRTLDVGSRVTCGVTMQGEALCTRVLNGDRWWELGPMQPVRAGARARQVAAFADWPSWNVCVVDEAGAAWCRGSNRTAQLGTGTPPARGVDAVDSLARVAGAAAFTRVVPHDGWMCGVDAAGRAFCWGVRAWREHYGADPPPAGGCERRACAPAPVAIGGGLRFRDIGAHRGRMCGVTAAGEAYCWAPTRDSAHADAADDYVPVREQPAFRFRQVAGNVEIGMGSCGITRAGDEVVCWGGANEHARTVRIPHPRRAGRGR